MHEGSDITRGILVYIFRNIMCEACEAIRPPHLHVCAMRRYYICDKKLAALGWSEKTSWKDGLAKTINWYMENGFSSRWVGDVDSALAAHPKAQ
jgi:nucleoside-diphosphate-sugar epimerase